LILVFGSCWKNWLNFIFSTIWVRFFWLTLKLILFFVKYNLPFYFFCKKLKKPNNHLMSNQAKSKPTQDKANTFQNANSKHTDTRQSKYEPTQRQLTSNLRPKSSQTTPGQCQHQTNPQIPTTSQTTPAPMPTTPNKPKDLMSNITRRERRERRERAHLAKQTFSKTQKANPKTTHVQSDTTSKPNHTRPTQRQQNQANSRAHSAEANIFQNTMQTQRQLTPNLILNPSPPLLFSSLLFSSFLFSFFLFSSFLFLSSTLLFSTTSSQIVLHFFFLDVEYRPQDKVP